MDGGELVSCEHATLLEATGKRTLLHKQEACRRYFRTDCCTETIVGQKQRRHDLGTAIGILPRRVAGEASDTDAAAAAAAAYSER